MKKDKKLKKDKTGKTSSKKRAKILIIALAVATVLLVALNSIDYDALADKIVGDKGSPTQDLVTYPDYAFKDPVYDEDILADQRYTELDRYVYLKIGNETNQLIGGSYDEGTMERFWLDYFDAVMHADSNALNSLHTDHFIEQNGKYGKFAPQKLYEINVEIINSRKVEDGEYAGYYQHFAKVNYYIFQNNGTFRNDIKSSESREQIFELLENRSGISIHTVSYPKEDLPTDTDEGVSFMISAWIALTVFSVIIEMLTVSLVAIWFMPAGIVALLLALFDMHIAVQIGAYLLVGVILLILSKTVLKNKLFSKKAADKADEIIGKRGVVVEKIDPVAETGEVDVDSECRSAKMADGGCAEVGENVTVVRAEGGTLYCERDQSE